MDVREWLKRLWLGRAQGVRAISETELSLSESSSTPEVLRNSSDRLDAVKRLRKYEGIMPADFKFDREDANRR